MGMCASCHESSVPFTQSDLGFPPDGLDHFGWFFQSQLHMAADLGGITGGPGAFAQDASGRGVARLGDRSLAALFARRLVRGDQAQKLHQFPWTLKTGEITHFRHQGDSHREWHPTQSLEGLDHGGQTSGFDVLAQFLLETLETSVCS